MTFMLLIVLYQIQQKSIYWKHRLEVLKFSELSIKESYVNKSALTLERKRREVNGLEVEGKNKKMNHVNASLWQWGGECLWEIP